MEVSQTNNTNNAHKGISNIHTTVIGLNGVVDVMMSLVIPSQSVTHNIHTTNLCIYIKISVEVNSYNYEIEMK